MRKLIWGSAALLLLTVGGGFLVGVSYAVWCWSFQTVIHRQLDSPDGWLTATITVRDSDPQPITVAITIRNSEGKEVSGDVYWHDMWIDLTDGSYPLSWRTNQDLRIGDRYGSFENGWRCEFDFERGKLTLLGQPGP